LLVDGRDIEDITAAITTLLGDRGVARRMGEAAREWVSPRWSWDAIVARFADDLAELAASAAA
jgi:phosphatidylinositol alpha-1,6-mannosyltransferase